MEPTGRHAVSAAVLQASAIDLNGGEGRVTLLSAPLPGADPRKCLAASNQTCSPGVWRNPAGRNGSQEDVMNQGLLVLKHMIDSRRAIVHHCNPLESHYVQLEACV